MLIEAETRSLSTAAPPRADIARSTASRARSRSLAGLAAEARGGCRVYNFDFGVKPSFHFQDRPTCLLAAPRSTKPDQPCRFSLSFCDLSLDSTPAFTGDPFCSITTIYLRVSGLTSARKAHFPLPARLHPTALAGFGSRGVPSYHLALIGILNTD